MHSLTVIAVFECIANEFTVFGSLWMSLQQHTAVVTHRICAHWSSLVENVLLVVIHSKVHLDPVIKCVEFGRNVIHLYPWYFVRKLTQYVVNLSYIWGKLRRLFVKSVASVFHGYDFGRLLRKTHFTLMSTASLRDMKYSWFFYTPLRGN